MSIDKLLNSNMEFRHENEKLKEQLDQSQELLRSANEELEKFKIGLSEKKSLSKEELDEIEGIKKEIIELKSQIEDANSKISELNLLLKNKEDDLDIAKEEIASLSTQINSNEGLNNTINKLGTKIQELHKDNIEKENIISTKDQLIIEKEKIIEEKNKEIESIKSQLLNSKPGKKPVIRRNIHSGRAKACIKCSEYAILHFNDSENQKLIKIFEKNHKGHTIIIVDLSEVKDRYRNVEIIKDSES
ncbi:MAG: hypothetical protein KGD63_13380 [Candidatus Lokiarchaeota archaeon]|nr:hypothetical protein [Candidatus Lokiarchaeota archaeon]